MSRLINTGDLYRLRQLHLRLRVAAGKAKSERRQRLYEMAANKIIYAVGIIKAARRKEET